MKNLQFVRRDETEQMHLGWQMLLGTLLVVWLHLPSLFHLPSVLGVSLTVSFLGTPVV